MNELYPIVSGALSGLAAAGALKGPIESLTQIWTLTLGRFSDDAYQKYKIKQAANLEKYANEVKSGIEKIPEENIQEPKMSVVGPAFEASKFYIEEDEIRGMFAKLIASSMDKTQSINIHQFKSLVWWMICRCRLLRSTTSASTIPICPTPAAAR